MRAIAILAVLAIPGLLGVAVVATAAPPPGRSVLVGLERDANPQAVAHALGGHVDQVVASRDGRLRFMTVSLPADGKVSADGVDGALGVGDDPVVWSVLQGHQPADPFYTQQQQTHLGALEAPAAWASSTGRTATIGFVDTGATCDHPDMAGAWLDNPEDVIFPGVQWVSYDSVANRYGGGCVDGVGHGTTVTALAGARSNNMGVVGVAYDARLMMARTLSAGTAQTIDVIESIIWLTEWRADVINMSLGTYTTRLGHDEVKKQAYDIVSVCAALDWAFRSGTVSVAAAGNDGRLRTYYPAGCPDTIGVGALASGSSSERWAGGATQGSTRGPHVDVVAPGSGLFSIQGGVKGRPYGDVGSGTSWSAALTSGVVALMYDAARRQGVTNNYQIALAARRLLQDTAVALPMSGLGRRQQGANCTLSHRNHDFGCGRVDAGAAVEAMEAWGHDYVARYGGRTATPGPGPTETPESGVLETPGPATATHIPAVQTALAILTGTPTPTPGPTETPDAEATEVSRILTEIAPPDETAVAATLTALAPNVAGTLTAVAPTPNPRQRAYMTATAAAGATATARAVVTPTAYVGVMPAPTDTPAPPAILSVRHVAFIPWGGR